MIRDALIKKRFSTTDFRWRSEEVSRLEGFSDAVFAFAVTLLVVSLEVPKTFDELLSTMSGFTAFAICFALLTSVWYAHYTYFRRYGLQDITTIVLNMVLLFVVLFFVYPLKFLFSVVVSQLAGNTVEESVSSAQTPLLFAIYGIGYVAVFLVFVLLYAHAYRKRMELELNTFEVFDTVSSIQGWLLDCSVGLLSIIIAVIGGPNHVFWAGMVYFLIGVERTIFGVARGKRRRVMEQQALRAEAA